MNAACGYGVTLGLAQILLTSSLPSGDADFFHGKVHPLANRPMLLKD